MERSPHNELFAKIASITRYPPHAALDINVIFSEKWTADIMDVAYACISTSQKRIAMKLKALK